MTRAASPAGLPAPQGAPPHGQDQEAQPVRQQAGRPLRIEEGRRRQEGRQEEVAIWRRWGLALLCIALLSACAARPVPEICTSMRPVYFPDEAIALLRPYRAQRETIAANNLTWESSCASD